MLIQPYKKEECAWQEWLDELKSAQAEAQRKEGFILA